MFLDHQEFFFFLWPVCVAVYMALVRWGPSQSSPLWIAIVSLTFWSQWESALVWRFLAALVLGYATGQLLVVGYGGRWNRWVFGFGTLAAIVPLAVGWQGASWAMVVGMVFGIKLIHYQWQCYRGLLPVSSPSGFAATLLFFPQFLPGFTTSFRDVSPQWVGSGPSGEDLTEGLLIFAVGWALWEACARGLSPWLLVPSIALLNVGVAQTFGVRLRWSGVRARSLRIPSGPCRWAVGGLSLALLPLSGHWLGAFPILFWLSTRDTDGLWAQAHWNPTVTAMLALLGIGLLPLL